MLSNRMTILLDKLERRLGTRQLNLPDYLQKDKWAEEVIANETLDTFSRFFPNAVTITLDRRWINKDGYYVIDDVFGENVEIIGVRDINWCGFDTRVNRAVYGFHNSPAHNYNLEDVMLIQGKLNRASVATNTIFVDFKAPNMVKFQTAAGLDMNVRLSDIPIIVLIKHAPNLMTIPTTMMETFEKLAEADVARFLYENLKFFDGLETVHASIDLKMSDLENKASTRDDIVEKLDEAHVSAANKNQPMIICV